MNLRKLLCLGIVCMCLSLLGIGCQRSADEPKGKVVVQPVPVVDDLKEPKVRVKLNTRLVPPQG